MVSVNGEVKPIASRQAVPPSVEYWYFVMADPLFIPAVKLTTNGCDPPVMVVIVGEPGVISGRTAAEATEVELPAVLVALTVKV